MDFTLAENATFFPCKSACGITAHPIVDTGCEMPAGGRVYLSVHEFRGVARVAPQWLDQVARSAGYIKPDDPECIGVNEYVRQLEEELAKLRPVAEAVGFAASALADEGQAA